MEGKTPEEIAKELNAKVEEFKEQVSKAATKEEITALTEKHEQEMASALEKVKGLEEEISGLKEKNDQEKKEVVKTIGDQVKENFETIQKFMRDGNGSVAIKANLVRASIANNTSSIRLDDVGRLGFRRRGIYELFGKTRFPIGNHNGDVRYIDQVESSTVRAAAPTAEAAASPESTATFQEFVEPLRKITDIIPISEEMMKDQVTVVNVIDSFLMNNVRISVDTQLMNGNGTGVNLNGLVTRTPAYTVTAKGVSGANIYDLAMDMRREIVQTRGSKYDPDFVVMNSNTLFEFHTTKDAENQYLFKGMMNIGPMEIIIDDYLANNNIIVGDSRKANIYEMDGVTIDRGHTDTQFAQGLLSLRAIKRIMLLIRNVDLTGFLKVTDVAAGLTTLAS